MITEVVVEKVEYFGWKNCVRLRHGELELVAIADIGPRILHAGFVGGENLLGVIENERGLCGGTKWRRYGGHRLWHSPEDRLRTYFPDNEPVEVKILDDGFVLSQETEPLSRIAKRIEVRAGGAPNQLRITHRLRNEGAAPAHLSPWALTIMRSGGMAFIPQAPYQSHDDVLVPNRNVTLWPYTQMADARVSWGNKFIRVQHDGENRAAWKVGTRSSGGWLAFVWEDALFVKKTAILHGAAYPDLNSSHEVYVDGKIIELETLAPKGAIEPGGEAQHTENWHFHKLEKSKNSDELEAQVAALATEG